MRKLGISIYPEHSTREKDKEYITSAAKYGFKRIFTCLLSVQGSKEEIVDKFTEIISHARKEGMEVIFDVAPHVFPAIGASYDNLEIFAQMGASGIRLDEGFGGQKEALMTHNPYGLKIEINISSGTKYVEQILSYGPNKDNLIGCHNFYPQEFTGLSYSHFAETSQLFKEHNIRTAAFVSSNVATFGPWPVNDGLCTLETHRYLPIVTQVKHLFATDLIDDVIIGNAYASEEELAALSKINPNKLSFRVKPSQKTSDLEKIIMENEVHFNRGDVSDYLIRSTQSRVQYQKESFPNHNTDDIQKGDVLVGNNDFGQYKGEMQIARLPMKNDGRKNIVGKIVKEEIFLLDYIKPWDYFELELEN